MDLRLLMIFVLYLARGSLGQDTDNDDDGDDEDPVLDPTPTTTNCTRPNGAPGVCANADYCDDDGVLRTGGIIDDAELRSANDCPNNNELCCTMENVNTPPSLANNSASSCLAPESDILPWTVALYKVVEKGLSSKKAFCLGALIGNNVVLTAATCLVAVQNLVLYVKVPASEEPQTKYTVDQKYRHINFNSGTHQYDFALLVLEEEVKWGKGPGRGACLGSQAPEGMCVTLGVNSNNDITSTVVNIQNGACNNYGGTDTDERFCAIKDESEGACTVANGAPVVCQSAKTNGGVVVGVARSGCLGDQILLGSVSHSLEWITKLLNTMKIQKDVYM